MAKTARTPASGQAAPKGTVIGRRPVRERRVSHKATANDGRTVGKAVLHRKSDSEDVPTKPRQKPVLKLEYALAKIRANVEHATKGYRSKLYIEYAECCVVAYRLKQSSSDWEKFCKLPFWMQRGRVKPAMLIENALYLVLIHAVFGLSRSQTQAASKVSIALKRFADERYEQQTIVKIIEEKGGVGNLARENASPKQPKVTEDDEPQAQGMVVGLVGSPLAGVFKHKLDTKFRIEAILSRDASGKKYLKCLGLDKIQ